VAVTDADDRADVGWTDYYDAHETRAAREMLLGVAASFERPGDAIDLGFGNGIETVALLDLGWRVHAIDAEPEAADRLAKRVPAGAARERLSIEIAPMEDAALPPADLVWAGYSLFFCDPERFDSVWQRVTTALRRGGRFAGQLLGDRDSWAPEAHSSPFAIAEARGVFDGWTIERFEEEEFDGEACSGPKHWHLFHVVARRPD
jgi:SAM-dependent methyltransferase